MSKDSTEDGQEIGSLARLTQREQAFLIFLFKSTVKKDGLKVSIPTFHPHSHSTPHWDQSLSLRFTSLAVFRAHLLEGLIAAQVDYKEMMEELGMSKIQQAYDVNCALKKKLLGTTATSFMSSSGEAGSPGKKRGRKPKAENTSNKRAKKTAVAENTEVKKEVFEQDVDDSSTAGEDAGHEEGVGDVE